MNTIYDNTFVLGETNNLTFHAGPGISITQPSEGTVRIANDETVLWSGELSVGQTASLTENYSAFRKLEFKCRDWSVAQNGQISYQQFGTETNQWQTINGWMGGASLLKGIFIGAYSANDPNHITLYSAAYNNVTATNKWVNASDNYRLFEIRGIGRKANS